MQQTRRQILYSIILLVGLVWIFLSADRSGSSTSGKIPAPQQGFLAPDFELQTPAGDTVRLSDLRGRAVLRVAQGESVPAEDKLVSLWESPPDHLSWQSISA